MKNDQLHRVLPDNRTTIPYLHSRFRLSNMKRFHDGLGHLKFDSIYELITRRYWWYNMQSDIKSYIAECPECQLDQSANSYHADTPIRPIPSCALPFERWGIDFIQNLPETKSGNKHIITAIDYATRWVVAKAVSRMDSNTVAEFLYNNILLNYGAQFELIFDRGAALISETLSNFEKLQGMRHFASTPYHPQTNGMVERMHAMVGHAITTLSSGEPERWDEYLPQSIFAIRVRKHAVTKHSPFYLLYGVHPRIPGDTNPLESTMQPLDELETIETNGEFVARTFEQLGDSRRAAYERSKIQADVMRKLHNLDPNAPEYYFSIGDMVKLKHHARTKFEFDWLGPYHVVDVGFPGTCWLMTPDGRRLDSTTAERDLAPWLKPTQSNVDFFYDGSTRTSSDPS